MAEEDGLLLLLLLGWLALLEDPEFDDTAELDSDVAELEVPCLFL